MKKLTMIYIGRRVNGERVLHAFLNNKKTYYWARVRLPIVGFKYVAEKDDKGQITMARNPKSVGSLDYDDVPEEWRDADSAADQFLKTRREESRARNLVSKNDWELLKPFYDRARKLSFFERIAFAEYVARLVLQGYK